MSFSSSSSVPIDMLPGIGHRTAKVLRQMHIRTIGEFKQVPEKILVELFGPSILRLYQYVQATKQPKQLQQPLTFKKRVTKKMKVAALTLTFL